MALKHLMTKTLTVSLLTVTSWYSLASDFLVSTDWLEQNLQNPKVRILEVSVNPGVHERGHIEGAANLVWHTDLVDTVKRDIVDKARFEQLLRNAGVSNDSTIVLYGDTNNWFAAWGAWIFDIYQVPNVKLLDGGRAKWEAEKRPLSVVQRQAKAGNINVGEPDLALRARLTDVLDIAEGRKNYGLVDIRSKDEYEGKIFAPAGVQETAVRAGHIPNAVNVPWVQAVAADGTFKSKEELQKLYASVGIDGSKPIVVYCRIGERSSHTWFALKKILGYDVRNYDGSWTEYGNSVGVPVVNIAGTIWGGK